MSKQRHFAQFITWLDDPAHEDRQFLVFLVGFGLVLFLLFAAVEILGQVTSCYIDFHFSTDVCLS